MTRFTRFLPVNVQIFLQEWGALLWIGASVAVLGIALLIYQASLGPHESGGFYHAEVLSTFDVSDDMVYDVRATVRLPTGALATIRARSIHQAQWLIDTACVEERKRSNGRRFYRLAAPGECAQ
ncbi:hypothetical protein FIU94_13425 [Sulfitobacter sp. THAF37]|uniref:hypothetical protein n=1 Tax=Sulfitobacter sp. THAF37 TaxID=2587855 RepID=UPI0012693B63|nr:hypothetical protein [Sulfitobacter sp. THAF37]QFT59828.1 hypothetical protein FIU94_13425 [Sulfitobacter sp. THAF37]